MTSDTIPSERKNFETAAGNMDSLAAFITEHCGDDPDRLALQKGKWPGIDVAAAVSTLVSRRKLAGKAPLWATAEGLVLPRTLSAEQCSGQAAARHKAAVALRIARRCGNGETAGCVSGKHPAGCSARFPGAEPETAASERAVKSTDGVRTRPRIADLTGGLGVDSLEFSRVAEAVLYNEMLPELAAAAEHNFRVLGARNIEVCCIEASPETLCGGNPEIMQSGFQVRRGNLRRRLEEFRPDVIYLDPARRDGCGKKVFLLEDCSPDILKIRDVLLKIAPVLMLKLSPMADISMLLDRLGGECRELHIVESGGECKELLIIMHRGDIYSSENWNDCLIRVYKLDGVNGGSEGDAGGRKQGDDKMAGDYGDSKQCGDGGATGCDTTDSPVLEFLRSEELAADRHRDGGQASGRPDFAQSEEIVPGALLFEPGKALMKAGCFRLIGERFGGFALGRDTHYYILRNCDTISSGKTPDAATVTFSETVTDTETVTSPETKFFSATGSEHFSGYRRLRKAGKLFRILDVTELSGKGVRDFAKRHPEAEVTARNIRMTSEELRRRLGCRPSDRRHIFALHIDRPDKNLLLFTERI